MELIKMVASAAGVAPRFVEATLRLLDEGASVPFIARYRKEATGDLDEVRILSVRDHAERIRDLEKRRQAILESLAENGHLTAELESRFLKAESLNELEDLYLPFRPKRKTRASVAYEKGLEPLALILLANQDPTEKDIEKALERENGAKTREEALAGAADIAAEKLSELPALRADLRGRFQRKALVTTKKAKGAPETGEFQEYYKTRQPLAGIPSHRFLALRRGEKEGALSVALEWEGAEYLETIAAHARFPLRSLKPALRQIMEDSWKRLIGPSLENEALSQAKDAADLKAVQVFAENLRELLLASPLGQKAILALDPGLRTGCKLVCLSAQGNLLDHTVIYPLVPHQKTEEAERILRGLTAKHRTEAFAIGNGTGGREALDFVRSLDLGLPVFSVSESGASVYSASEVARKEFPNEDVTVRGAISIGRRLMDPLAELVKIDPKSIGVGQYQHDVDQKLLKKILNDVVVSSVNKVGVDVNTATAEILSYVSGLNARLAENLLEYRTRNGPFPSREEFQKIKGFGPKTFEQCAGFLRIRGGVNLLDASGVHPERYALVRRIAQDLGCELADLVGKPGLKTRISPSKYLDETLGAASLDDLIRELEKPGVDPRSEIQAFSFDSTIKEITDLQEGMILPGIVTNVTAFGAFVDIGVHQDGLVHISQLSRTYVSDPMAVVKVGQSFEVKVLAVDLARRRISLSRKAVEESN